MADFEKLKKSLEEHGIHFQCFATAQAASDYLDGQVDGTTVGIGGSETVKSMGLSSRLAAHNQVIWHWEGGKLSDAAQTEVYLTSANALAETGEIINIDGNCNRIASSVFGHRRVYFLVGINKLERDYDRALWRARNVAAPKRAQSLGRKTPCAVKADRCYDCKSPERVCRGLMVIWCRPSMIEHMEVILIQEELGM